MRLNKKKIGIEILDDSYNNIKKEENINSVNNDN